MVRPPLRVLVVLQDHRAAGHAAQVLRGAGADVVTVADPAHAPTAAAAGDPDVVVADADLLTRAGRVVETVRTQAPDAAVLLLTDRLDVEGALTALRHGAQDLLVAPVDGPALVGAVERLGARARGARSRTRRAVVLAVGAHPDDVEIGVGGTLAAHRARGDAVVVLTLSRGARGGAAAVREAEAVAAAELLGARLFLRDLPDTALGTSGATLAAVEEVVAEVRPDVVYTHGSHDRHQDHRAVHDATVVAARRVPFVACYQSPSSTVDFRPTSYATIDGHVETKLALLRCYASQSAVRAYLDPALVVATARYWSRLGDGTAVEPLEVVRDVTPAHAVATTRVAAATPTAEV